MAEKYDISMYCGPLAPQPKPSRIFLRPGMTEPSGKSLSYLVLTYGGMRVKEDFESTHEPTVSISVRLTESVKRLAKCFRQIIRP